MNNTTLAPAGNTPVGVTPEKVVPLLSSVQRLENLAVSLSARLDPITQHVPQDQSTATSATNTITNRLNQIGDVLQYLLDNIEL